MPSPGAAGRGGSASPRDGRAERFPRKHRLRARRQFLAVYSGGQRVRSSSMTLFAAPNKEEGCRLGITVTRKVGGAVRRNRVKRMFREMFRRRLDRMPDNVDLVVNAHVGIHERSFEQIEREFLRNVDRLVRRLRS